MACTSIAVAALLVFSATHAADLQEFPLMGDFDGGEILYLDGEGWIASNGINSVGATVPGDLISDLQRAGLIADPLYDLTFQGRLWDATEWTYTSPSFDVSTFASASEIYLVFDSIKMGADVSLNGVHLNSYSDQFLRHSLPVKSLLKSKGNVLTVTFRVSTDPLNNETRWMACSGAWDWAPYASTTYVDGTHTFSKGIVKSVYLVPVHQAAITAVVPHIVYTGPYPRTPLTPTTASPFNVTVTVHFECPSACSGSVIAQGNWSSVAVSAPLSGSAAGQYSVTLNLPLARNVDLWWPNGLGEQALYKIVVNVTTNGTPVVSLWRNVGFRALYLVTTDESPSHTGENGSGNFTMRFKVNGADIYNRGANMIPMEELEARQDPLAYKALLQSAAEGNYNMLRIWGGGIFLPPVFYDTCDRLGILLFQDMMYGTPWFGGSGGTPINNEMQAAEIRHNVRNLAHHPSIAIWNGGNEWYKSFDLWETFVIPTIVMEDATRPVWVTSPSRGWDSGVDTLTGLPNGQPFKARPHQSTYDVSSAMSPSLARAEFVAALSSPSESMRALSAKIPNCTFLPDKDVYNSAGGVANLAENTQACCAQCTVDPQCTLAVFLQGTCYLKYGGSIGPATKQGCTVCNPNKPTPPDLIETHGPYQHGSGFKTVNGNAALEPFPPNIPPALRDKTACGTNLPGTFASEFGCSVFSSFESMAPTLPPYAWTPHAASMVQRNYPCDSIIWMYFGPQQDINTTQGSADVFRKTTYLCTMGQALEMKSDIEHRRSYNSFGTLTWQLNEIWPTGGWGSVEYGTIGWTPGQVLGGRWKALHHWMAAHLYNDQIVVCGDSGACYAKNDDAINPFSGTWTVTLVSTVTGSSQVVASGPVSLARGAGAITWFCAGDASVSPAQGCPSYSTIAGKFGTTIQKSLLQVTLQSAQGSIADSNDVYLTTFADIASGGGLQDANVTVQVHAYPDALGHYTCVLVSDAPAHLVQLTTAAHGRFSKNAFFMPPGRTVVSFIPSPYIAVDVGLLVSSTRVEHVAAYV